jgi:hypothetical protein
MVVRDSHGTKGDTLVMPQLFKHHVAYASIRAALVFDCAAAPPERLCGTQNATGCPPVARTTPRCPELWATMRPRPKPHDRATPHPVWRVGLH